MFPCACARACGIFDKKRICTHERRCPKNERHARSPDDPPLLTCMQIGQKVMHAPHLEHMHWWPQSKHTVFVALRSGSREAADAMNTGTNVFATDATSTAAEKKTYRKSSESYPLM